jgi:hypothetical protein
MRTNASSDCPRVRRRVAARTALSDVERAIARFGALFDPGGALFRWVYFLRSASLLRRASSTFIASSRGSGW